jgi:hypothetical protein
MPGPDSPPGGPHAPGTRLAVAVLDRVVRVALCVLFAGTSLLGLLAVEPVRLLGGGAACAPAVTGFWALLFYGCTDRWPRRDQLLDAACVGASLPLFFGGVRLLGDAGQVVALIVVVLVTVRTMRWLAELPDGAGADDRRRPAPGLAARAPQRAALRALPSSALLVEWDATERSLRAGPDRDERLVLAMLREHLLDELTRRDPDAVATWLHEGGPPRGDTPDEGGRTS